MSDAFPGVRAVATPAVAESMRTVAPQDHWTYAPVYGDNLAADYRRQPVWPGAPPFEAEDRVVVMKLP